MRDRVPLLLRGRERQHFYVTEPGNLGIAPVVSILLELGHTITTLENWAVVNPVMDFLIAKGMNVEPRWDGRLPDGLDAVICNSATPDSHYLVQAATKRRIRVVGRGPAIGGIADLHRYRVGVTGTSGKSTIAAMTTTVLGAVGSPSYIIGAPFPGRDFGGHLTSDPELAFLVVEAHEDDLAIFATRWDAFVLANFAEYPDHVDRFGGPDGLHEMLVEALRNAKNGLLLVCADDRGAMKVAVDSGVEFITYGTSADADWHVTGIRFGATTTTFDLLSRTENKIVAKNVMVPLPGLHAAVNAAAALVIGSAYGVEFSDGARQLATFQPPEGRFQMCGKHNGAEIVFDYANLPGEVDASVASAQHGKDSGRWERCIVVVGTGRKYVNSQWASGSHRLKLFADALRRADQVVLTQPYLNGPGPDMAGAALLGMLRDSGRDGDVYVERRELAAALREILQPRDLCLVTGGLLKTLPGELMKPRGLEVAEVRL